jgi:hypothetical protein
MSTETLTCNFIENLSITLKPSWGGKYLAKAKKNLS